MKTTVSIWPGDEAYRRLLEAIQIFKEIHGSYDTTKFLQQEITRETVVREYHASRYQVLAAEQAAKQANELLAIATDVLGFYADKDNWKTGDGKGVFSAVSKDKGRAATQALEAIIGGQPDEQQGVDDSEDE